MNMGENQIAMPKPKPIHTVLPIKLRRCLTGSVAASIIMISIGILLTGPESTRGAEVVPESRDTWQGYSRVNFSLDGRKCFIVEPENKSGSGLWIWRARFFGHEPQLDLALLERGYHLAFCDVSNLYGNDEAVQRWDTFYEFATREFQLDRRVVLEGMSRGGLIIYNWAAANPDKVAAIYADAPVLDIRSWPGGMGKGKKSAGDWSRCLAAYNLTEESTRHFDGNPFDRLAPLASAGIPLIHVVGMADDVVPVSENTDILAARYQKLGGRIQVIRKKGVGHHPHSLRNPELILNFLDRFSLNHQP